MSSQQIIRDCIQKIATGGSYDRIKSSPSGTGGVGTARMIHGYVSKIHDDPSDSEYDYYKGTIDVTEFVDETVGSEPFTYKGVMLSGKEKDKGGFLIIPFMHSDVSIITDAGTKMAYVVDFSHANVVQIDSHKRTFVGSTETEELDINSNDSPDYDELEKTGNESYTEYTPNRIYTVVKDKNGEIYSKETNQFGYKESLDGSSIEFNKDEIKQTVGESSIIIQDGKVYIGGESIQPAVHGIKLTSFLKTLLGNIAKITVPTSMGTMPIINIPDFVSMVSQVDEILSEFVFIK